MNERLIDLIDAHFRSNNTAAKNWNKAFFKRVDAAVDAGKEPCCLCGRAIAPGHVRVQTEGDDIVLGPDCAKKLRALGATW